MPERLLDHSTPVVLFPVRLETRFVDSRLLVRIYPDQIAIQTHQAGLSKDEAEFGNAFRKAGDKKAVWRALVQRQGPQRALWIARNAILNHGELTAAPNQTAGTAAVLTLPDYFKIYIQTYDPTHRVWSTEASGLTKSRHGPLAILDSLVEVGRRLEANESEPTKTDWMSSYDQAIECGMAVSFELANIPAHTFSSTVRNRIIAVGLKNSDPMHELDLLQNLLDNHHYTTGVSLVNSGAPTNNTLKTKSDYSEYLMDVDGIFDQEIAPLLNPSSTASATKHHPFGDELRWAFGAPSTSNHLDCLRHVDGAVDNEFAKFGAINRVIWPAIGDSLVAYGFTNSPVTVGDRKQIWDHFSRYVRPRGAYPAIRIGNLPYGILPVSRIRKFTATDRLERVLHVFLKSLFEKWLALAIDPNRVPRLGGSDDPDRELIQVLSMEPASVSCDFRPFVDERFIGYLRLAMWRESAGGPPARLTKKDLQSIYSWATPWQSKVGETARLLAELLFGIAPSEQQIKLVNEWTILAHLVSWGPGNQIDWTPDTLESVFDNLVERARKQISDFDDTSKRDFNVALSSIDSKMGGQLLPDVLDACAFRVDAWLTSFAYKRLMRIRDRGTSGILIGAYGWVENLRQATPVLGQYIHAPSVDQASMSAVLRSAYMAHQNDPNGNAFAFNLTSERVRQALELINGVRAGQRLSALLGYQLERALHDAKQDIWIAAFRTCYPMATTGDSAENTGAPQEVIGPTDVTDGLTLAKDWHTDKGKVSKCVTEQAPSLVLKEPVTWILDQLVDTLDGLSDLLLTESVYQAVQSNPVRAGAAMAAADGSGVPPEIESIRTQMQGIQLRHRVGFVLDATSFDPQSVGLRAKAEPVLNAWLLKLLGPLENIRCIVTASPSQECAVALSDLEIDPIDFLYLSTASPSDGNTELELRILRKARESLRCDECSIDFTRKTCANDQGLMKDRPIYSISEAGTLVSYARALFARSAVFRPGFFQVLQVEDSEADSTAGRPLPQGTVQSGDQSTGSTTGRPPYGDKTTDSTTGRPLPEGTAQPGNPPTGSALGADGAQVPQANDQPAKSAASIDREELLGRVNAAYNKLVSHRDLRKKSDPDKKSAIERLSQFGIDLAFSPVFGVFSGQTTASTGTEDKVEQTKKEALLAEVNVTQETLLAEVEKRLTSCEGLLKQSENCKDNDPDRSIQLLCDAAKALFGEQFVVLPRITLSGEFLKRINQGKLEPSAADLYKWLHQAAQTHPNLQQLDDLNMLAEAWNPETVSQFHHTVVQFPVLKEQSSWFALPIGGSNKRPHLALSFEMFGPQDVLNPQNGGDEGVTVCGLIVDEWHEVVPGTTQDTGVSFQFNQPDTQAPQALLLAVPDDAQAADAVWTDDEIAEIVSDTMDLMKVRAVDLDALADRLDCPPGTEHLGNLFPSLFLPANPDKPDWPVGIGNDLLAMLDNLNSQLPR